MNMDHKKKKKSRVGPSSSDDQQDQLYFGNSSFELDVLSDLAKKNKSQYLINNFRTVKEPNDKAGALEALCFVKKSGSKWRKYHSSKRTQKVNINESRSPTTISYGKFGTQEHDQTDHHGLDENSCRSFLENYPTSSGKTSRQEADSQMTTASNHMLLQYFSKLGKSKSPDEKINLDFVETLLKNGASIDCADQYGQTILHEVARAWHIDVAKFLLEFGADINKPDYLGRTPLHVAAAVDYADMVALLIEKKANKEAKTFGENQTPVHYAAKKDACRSLKVLIKNACQYSDVKDYKGRTPLQVAAELDRSESARLLLDLDVPAGVSDNSGQKTLTWMITKMPPVAMEALNQLHTTNRPNRKQYLYLNLLVQDMEKDPEDFTYTPLQVAVNFKQYDLLMHKVFLCLIDKMWIKFTRLHAWLNLIQNFVTIVLWSIIGVVVKYDEKYSYPMPDHWWRIVILLLAVGFTTWQIIDEVIEYYRSQRLFQRWKKWRASEIEKDLQFCHDRWPEEKLYLDSEISHLDHASPKYFKDYWNIFDWLCYFLLMGCIATHVFDIFFHSNELALAHIRLMSITIILLWLRLMKNARAFALLGPFIVMLSHMFTDLVKFIFLYLEFFLPYACAFWMIFGGSKIIYEGATVTNVTVGGFGNFGEVFFSLFRLTLVDDYDYANMKLVDSFMADLLVGTWLALSAILCLNLFIALLSETFQRVYDNAQAHAVMQRAITILNIWDGMSRTQKGNFLEYIRAKCSPKEEDYDDDITDATDDDLKKVTVQIKAQLDEMQEQWKHKFGDHNAIELFGDHSNDDNGGDDDDDVGGGKKHVTKEIFENECAILQESIGELRDRQDDMVVQFREDMNTVKALLLEMTGRSGGGGGDIGSTDGRIDLDRTSRSRSSHRRKKSRRKSQSDVLPRPHEEPSIEFSAATIPQITRTAGSFQSPQDSA